LDEAFGVLSSECEPEEEDCESCAGDEACAACAAVGCHLRWWMLKERCEQNNDDNNNKKK
jgi:hypothetical protein